MPFAVTACGLLSRWITMTATLLLLALVGLLVSSHVEPAPPKPVKIVN